MVNEHEAALLLGGQLADDCATTARQLPELGPRSVVITLGANTDTARVMLPLPQCVRPSQ